MSEETDSQRLDNLCAKLPEAKRKARQANDELVELHDEITACVMRMRAAGIPSVSATKPAPPDDDKPIRPQTLFTLGDKGAIVTIPPNYSTNDWAAALVAFEEACRHRIRPLYGAMTNVYTLHPDQMINGVYYSWGLANERGAWFIVHRFPESTLGALDACHHELRRNRDVVSLKVAHVKEWVDFTPPPPETSKPQTPS